LKDCYAASSKNSRQRFFFEESLQAMDEPKRKFVDNYSPALLLFRNGGGLIPNKRGQASESDCFLIVSKKTGAD
jgi:hypothetical protein